MITDRQPIDLKKRLLELATKPANVTTTIPATELGPDEVVHLRRLSLGDRMAIMEIARDKESEITERQLRMLSIVLANPDGSRAFPTTDGEDRQALMLLPNTLADRICEQSVTKAANATPTKDTLDAGKASSATTQN